MPSTSAIRLQIENLLGSRIPSALTPPPRIIRPIAPTGLSAVDDVLGGGLPLGAITEMAGQECSGRTTLALSFLAQLTQGAKVCAWIDVSNALQPESAAAAGVDLSRLLWVRCGVYPAADAEQSGRLFQLAEQYLTPRSVKKGLHGGGFGPHPRSEVKGLSDAVSGLMRADSFAPRYAEPQPRARREQEICKPHLLPIAKQSERQPPYSKPWTRLEQALRATDLLLQGGGFSAIVLDMGSIAPEHASRVPLATWFRYRAAAERTEASILLLTQHPCAKSSAGLLLHMEAADAIHEEATLFTGVEHRFEIQRQRFVQAANILPLKKSPQRRNAATWQSRSIWAGRR